MHSGLTRWGTGLTAGAVALAVLAMPTTAEAAGTDVVVTSAPTPTASPAPAAAAPVSPEVKVEQTKATTPAGATGAEAAVKRTEVAPFHMAGVTWDAAARLTDVVVRVQVRTGGRWGAWEHLEVEDQIENGRPGTVPLWTSAEADGIAVDASAAGGRLSGVKVTTIDPGGAQAVTPVSAAVFHRSDATESTPVAASDGTPTVVPMPAIITRAQWGAGAGTSCSAPTSQPKALGVVIHHTAGSNTYTAAQAAGLVRSYQAYHVKGHGWCDIGYNFLVDRFGRVYEGRKGGMLKQVRAAHSGVDAVNQWATGISMMGNFETVAPSDAMKSAVVRLVGWRLKFFGAAPKGTYVAGGKRYNVITGHRDVKSTACPGKYAYAWIGQVGGLRDRVASYLSKAKSAAGSPPPVTYPAPTGLSATVTSPTTATVRWTAVPGAPGYRVLVRTTGRPDVSVPATGTTATITGLNPTTKYTLYVSVNHPTSGARYSAYSAPLLGTVTPAFSAPTGLRVLKTTSTTIQVAWNPRPGAPGYRVLVSPTGSGTKAKYASVRSYRVTLKKLKKGQRYRIRVSVINPVTRVRWSPYTAAPYPSAVPGVPVAAPVTAPTAASRSAAAVSANVATVKSGRVTFKGRGYGHGIGMSQYGAEGGARQGQTYAKILAKYYPGTQLSTRTGNIRVLLTADTTNSVYVRPAAGLRLRVLSSNAVTALPGSISGRVPVAWSIDNAKANRKMSSLYYKAGSRWYTYRTFTGSAQFEGPATIPLVLPSGKTVAYRGALRSAVPKAGSTARDTVNVLSIENYTRGVVAREMPSSWHQEALRAQSVAARTYGVRSLGTSRYYDICDTTSCQVYGGYAAETAATNAAVAATSGKIVTYGGKPALTQFSSSSGGYTNVGSAPYLRPVADSWDGWSGNRNRAWTATVTTAAIQRKYPSVGTVRSLTVTRRNGYGTSGGRVVSLTIKGTKGSKTISGVSARWAFGLRSDWFGF